MRGAVHIPFPLNAVLLTRVGVVIALEGTCNVIFPSRVKQNLSF